MHHRDYIVGRTVDIVATVFTVAGTSVYAVFDYLPKAFTAYAPIIMQQNLPSPPSGTVADNAGYGGVVLAIIGLCTLIARLIFSDRHETRQHEAMKDDSLSKLAKAEAALAEAIRRADEARLSADEARKEQKKIAAENEGLQKVVSKVDENSRKIADMELAQQQLTADGIFRATIDDDASDVHRQPFILIVDDDDNTASRLSRWFRGKGFVPHTACSIREAKVKARTYDPQWVILDVKLLDGSGLEVLKYLRDNNFRAKVFVMTGAVSAEGFPEDGKYKPDAFLFKPFDPSEMWLQMNESAEHLTINPTIPPLS